MQRRGGMVPNVEDRWCTRASTHGAHSAQHTGATGPSGISNSANQNSRVEQSKPPLDVSYSANVARAAFWKLTVARFLISA